MSNEAPPRPVISVVIPMHNEQEVMHQLFGRLIPVMTEIAEPFEIVCVDDGSRDDTWRMLRLISVDEPRIRPLRLSRNFGKEIAMTAGLDAAQGEAVVFIDADLQDPPELIGEFVKLWRQGYQNVYGLRTKRAEDTISKRTTAGMFYSIFNHLSDTPLPANAGDFRLLGPDAVRALRACRERQRFMKGLYTWVGFASIAVPYERPARAAGQTKFSMFRLWNFALEGITSHSTVLLRAWTYVGLIAIAFGVLLGVWLLIEYFAFGRNPPGFYLTVFVVLGFSSLNFIMLGILGEYVGRIYQEVKNRPLYFLRNDDLE
ncbi:MAG: glycosyltransferase family 2 protein [Alphaproteobacteria bacterium]|nr:glycosyltransferase family 2 protein [Alphaproteobacteria bacterium]